MLKTNLKNFYVGDNYKVKIQNIDNFEACDVEFKSNTSAIKITTTKELIDGKDWFTFYSKNISPAGRYSVFVEFYNTTGEQEVESDRFGILKVMNKESDEYVILLEEKIEMLNVVDDKILERARSDYSSYTIGTKSLTALSIDELRNARIMIKNDIATLKRKIGGGKANRILFNFRENE